MSEQGPSKEESFSARRAREFMASMPAELSAKEDRLPGAIRSANAARKAKLFKIYQVADEISAARAPFVACGKGCSHCCHMTIRLTSAEAERLGSAIGRAPVKIASNRDHGLEKFAGVPCPFLVDDVCSVYENRPLSCRTHASFEADNSNCHPERMNKVVSMLVNFDGLDKALFEASSDARGVVLADIRDFFPSAR